MKKIYFAIITLLFALCLFLASYSFGLFNFGAFSSRDEFSAFAKARRESAETLRSWNIAVLGDNADQVYISEIAQGIGRAALQININGGVLGKPLVVDYVEPDQSSFAVNLAVQKLCEDPDTAFLIGPMSASRLTSVRSLTQYHCLPALAPDTPLFPELPQLDPDLFGALNPARLLLDPMVERLKELKCRNVLFITSGLDSYGGIFTGLMNQKLQHDPFFDAIHRIDFVSPADESQMRHLLTRIYENSKIDAFIFTDTPRNLRVLARVMKDLEIDLPVFGTDLLAVPTLRHYIEGSSFPLYYGAFAGKIIPDDFAVEYTALFRRNPSLKEQLGILSCLFFRDAVNELATYDPIRVGEKIKELSMTYLSGADVDIRPTIHEINTRGGESHED